jgi:hypothetical protein
MLDSERKGGELVTRTKKYGKAHTSGRRTVDYMDLADPLEKARKELGFLSFAEFARQIARDYLKTRKKLI